MEAPLSAQGGEAALLERFERRTHKPCEEQRHELDSQPEDRRGAVIPPSDHLAAPPAR